MNDGVKKPQNHCGPDGMLKWISVNIHLWGLPILTFSIENAYPLAVILMLWLQR